jgi:hypothetical protein
MKYFMDRAILITKQRRSTALPNAISHVGSRPTIDRKLLTEDYLRVELAARHPDIKMGDTAGRRVFDRRDP